MSTAPAFQFYVKDWRNSVKLRLCSPAARGAWMDILCLLHDSDEYGVLRVPLKDLAKAAGVPLRLARELADKGVLKGGDDNPPPYFHTPRHAGKDGEPVLLVDTNRSKSCWFCSRFVRDEWLRSRRGIGTRFSSERQPGQGLSAESGAAGEQPTRTPTRRMGERQGDGPATAFASALGFVGSFEDGTDVTQDADRAAALAALGTRNGRASRELRAAGLTDCTPSRPELSAALDQGITVEELVEVARECVPKGKTGIAYIVKAAIGRRADAAAIVVPNKPATAGPVAGYSPPAVSTAETKWRDEIAVARQNVGYGVWTQEQADARLAERAAALGFEWPEKPAGQPSTATEPPNA